MKLRLLLFEECNRKRPGCCNKDWDLDVLPVVESYKGCSEILLTGGEPMLRPDIIKRVVKDIRAETDAKIYLYTAHTRDLDAFRDVLEIVDGVTVTLHDNNDVRVFNAVSLLLGDYNNKSLRLNVFANVTDAVEWWQDWKVKRGMEWIESGPLPAGEVFMRLAQLEE